jgi:hypothetical protein
MVSRSASTFTTVCAQWRRFRPVWRADNHDPVQLPHRHEPRRGADHDLRQGPFNWYGNLAIARQYAKGIESGQVTRESRHPTLS